MIEFTTPAKAEEWDAVEVHPVKFINKARTEVEQCEAAEADFWSVYLHLTSGGVRCVADVPTKKLANQLKKVLEVTSASRQRTKEELLHVLDVRTSEVNLATFYHLSNYHIAYRDTLQREHLLNIVTALEPEEWEQWKPKRKDIAATVKKDLQKLRARADKNDCAYIRFIDINL